MFNNMVGTCDVGSTLVDSGARYTGWVKLNGAS